MLCICYKKNAQAADVPGRFTSTRTATAVEWLLLSSTCASRMCSHGESHTLLEVVQSKVSGFRFQSVEVLLLPVCMLLLRERRRTDDYLPICSVFRLLQGSENSEVKGREVFLYRGDSC